MVHHITNLFMLKFSKFIIFNQLINMSGVEASKFNSGIGYAINILKEYHNKGEDSETSARRGLGASFDNVLEEIY